MEVICKPFLGVINWRVGVAVQFHDVLHVFLLGRGTGTASLEAKLLQQMMEMREEFLYGAFLDL